MERRIVVPLDGSALAEAVLPHAVLVARHTGRTLTLLRVVPSSPALEPLIGALPIANARMDAAAAETEEARRYLAVVAGRLVGAHLKIELTLAEGDPATAIIEYATQHAEGLLVAMATHGRTGARRWVFGSVAERVLHAIPVPLLLVRPPGLDGARTVATPAPAVESYQTILVPLDGSTLAEQALAPARSLAKALDTILVLVGVAPASARPRNERKAVEGAAPLPSLGDEDTPEGASGPRDHYLEQMARALRAGGVPAEPLVTYGHPAEGILHASEQVGADLIVMATHGRSGLQHLWLGSVALKVVQGTNLPVLLVRAQALPERERDPADLEHVPAWGLAARPTPTAGPV